MLNCKQATAMMSQNMDDDIGIMGNLNLRFHLMMCSGCRNFNKQIAFLRKGCQKFSQCDELIGTPIHQGDSHE